MTTALDPEPKVVPQKLRHDPGGRYLELGG